MMNVKLHFKLLSIKSHFQRMLLTLKLTLVYHFLIPLTPVRNTYKVNKLLNVLLI